MVAGDVVELDAVVVEVVEDGQAELVSLAVVGLAAAGTEYRFYTVIIVHIIGGYGRDPSPSSVRPGSNLSDALPAARGPGHGAAGDAAAGPEVLLTSAGNLLKGTV